MYFTSRTIYEKLGGAVSEDQRALYVQRVEEIVPNIRYCAYNIGDTSDISQLVKLRTDTPGFDMLASKIDVCMYIKAVCLLCYSSAYRSLLHLILLHQLLSLHTFCLFVCLFVLQRMYCQRHRRRLLLL